MKDVPEGGHVLTSTFSLNDHPIIILFNSGAPHDFISKAYTQKHKLAVKSIRTPYMIHSPGGNVFTKQLAVITSWQLRASTSFGGCEASRAYIFDGELSALVPAVLNLTHGKLFLPGGAYPMAKSS
jgi:hypothetical protein